MNNTTIYFIYNETDRMFLNFDSGYPYNVRYWWEAAKYTSRGDAESILPFSTIDKNKNYSVVKCTPSFESRKYSHTDILRASGLAKLTDEEKKALGLKDS